MLAVVEKAPNVGGVNADQLRSLVERIERLHEERKALSNDVADIFKEVKSCGYEVKVVRLLLRVRAQDAAEAEEQDTLLRIYMRALGM